MQIEKNKNQVKQNPLKAQTKEFESCLFYLINFSRKRM